MRQGQLHAIWRHRVTDREAAAIVGAHIPVLVLHGRHDILAHPRFGEQLARRCASLLAAAVVQLLNCDCAATLIAARSAPGWRRRACCWRARTS